MWRDEAWLLDMLQACRRALQHAEGLTEQGFHASALYQDAIIRQLTVLGEAAKQTAPEFRDAHPEVPWKKIAGFRDVVVHAYFRLDLDQVGASFKTTFRASRSRLNDWFHQRKQAGEAGTLPRPESLFPSTSRCAQHGGAEAGLYPRRRGTWPRRTEPILSRHRRLERSPAVRREAP
jgi:uncharacterized protein with HEPN domain